MRKVMRKTILLPLLLFSLPLFAQAPSPSACNAGTVNTAYNDNVNNVAYLCVQNGSSYFWKANVGIGAPTVGCSSVNYGASYTDVSAGVGYKCGQAGWTATGSAASGGAASIGTRLRAAASAAAWSNPYINPPLNPAPAWVALTAYKAGQVVANGGQLFICYVGGTSAASGGPSGPSQLQITDGSVTWYWYGVQQVTSAAPGAPVVTDATSISGSITQFVTIATNPSQFYVQGGPPCTVFGSDIRVQSVTQASGGNNSCNNTSTNAGVAVSFVTDAPLVVIEQAANTAYQIIVDGSYAFPGAKYSANKGDGTGYTILDFSTGGGRKARTVTLQGSSQGQVLTPVWVGVDAISSIWAPTAPRITGCILGDSQTGGGNSFPIGPRDSWPVALEQLMGWTDMRNAAIGGTGYIAPGTQWPFINHVSDVTTYGCDVILIAGGTNDVGYTAAQVTSAVVTLLQTIHNAVPSVPVFAIGLIGGEGGPDAAHLTTENAVKAGVTQAGYSNMYFIPSLTNVPIWFKGTGCITATNGSGNTDVYIGSDCGHLDQYGQGFLARQVANVILAYINKLP